MPEQRTWAQQAGAVVNVSIIPGLWKKTCRPLYFVPLLGKVSLQIQPWNFRQQRTAGLQLGLAGRQRKARRDGIMLAAASMPAFRQALALVISIISMAASGFPSVL